MVCSLDGDTDFFDIVTGILQGDSIMIYVYNLTGLHTTNVHRSNKRK